MTAINEAYAKIEKKFVEWAQTREDIRAAFVVGSRARTDHPADQWSDLDVILFTSDQQAYLDQDDWVKQFGNLWISFVTKTAGNDWERLNLFENGIQVDFVIMQEKSLKDMVKHQYIPDIFYRGVRVLIDKDNVAEIVVPKQNSIPALPGITEPSFLNTVSMFWFVVSYIRKQLHREELWVAKLRESDLRGLLYQMIAWHEKVVRGPDYDT